MSVYNNISRTKISCCSMVK